MKPARAMESEVILLVDGERRTRDLCRKLLVPQGYTVLEADNGMDALLVAASRRGHVDLLLTDVTLPRMTGARLAGAFHLLWPGVPVAYLASGPGAERPVAKAGVIPKTLLATVLTTAVDGLLHHAGHSRLVH